MECTMLIISIIVVFQVICKKLRSLNIHCDSYMTEIVQKLGKLDSASWIETFHRTLNTLRNKATGLEANIAEAIASPQLNQEIARAVGTNRWELIKLINSFLILLKNKTH